MLTETPSLLITDDDRDFRETLRAAFEPIGFETHLASTGREALEIVENRRIHLALFDMHMPQMTGLETIRLLKKQRAMLPCILMSADLDEMIIHQAEVEQVFSVLPKLGGLTPFRRIVIQAMRVTYSWETE